MKCLICGNVMELIQDRYDYLSYKCPVCKIKRHIPKLIKKIKGEINEK